jgi:hypothetical protein
VRIDEAKLRETIKRLLLESGVKDPNRGIESQTDREKVFETVLIAAEQSARDATQTLTALTADQSSTPEFLRKYISEGIVITSNASPAILDGKNPTDKAVLDLIRRVNPGGTDGDEDQVIDTTPIVTSNVPGEVGGGYDLSKDSLLRSTIVDPYKEDLNKVMIVGNIFAQQALGESGGNMAEFTVAVLFAAMSPNVNFYNLTGNESGRDVIAEDGGDVYKLESKFSKGSKSKKNKITYDYNFDMGKTPPDLGDNKYYIFSTLTLPTGIVRGDIMFLFWSIAPGDAGTDLPATSFNINSPDAKMFQNFREMQEVIDGFDEMQKLLTASAKTASGKSNEDHAIEFVQRLAAPDKSSAREKLKRILRKGAYHNTGHTDETISQAISINPADKKLQGIQRRLTNTINNIENSIDGLTTGDGTAEDSVINLLKDQMAVLEKLHVIKYHGVAEQQQALTPKVGDEQTMGLSADFKPGTGDSYTQTLLRKNGPAAAWFIYNFLRNPFVSLTAKKILVQYLTGARRLSSGQFSDTESQNNMVKISRLIDISQDAKKLAISQTLRNKNAVKRLPGQALSQLLANQIGATLSSIPGAEGRMSLGDLNNELVVVDFDGAIDIIYDVLPSLNIPTISSFPDNNDPDVAQLLIQLAKHFNIADQVGAKTTGILNMLGGKLEAIIPDSANLTQSNISRTSQKPPAPNNFPQSNRRPQPPKQGMNQPVSTTFGSRMRFENILRRLNENEEISQLPPEFGDAVASAFDNISQEVFDDNQAYGIQFSDQDFKTLEAELLNAESENIEESKLYESIIRKLLAASKKRR